MPSDWLTRWRLNRSTFNPEQVRVLPVADNFVLVEGEAHTSYAGGYFATPDAAFEHETAEIERSRRYAEERQERLKRAIARFNN